jgi:hypothetical protein
MGQDSSNSSVAFTTKIASPRRLNSKKRQRGTAWVLVTNFLRRDSASGPWPVCVLKEG